MSVALGALGGLLPGVVLHSDIGSVLNQGLLEEAETCDPSGNNMCIMIIPGKVGDMERIL